MNPVVSAVAERIEPSQTVRSRSHVVVGERQEPNGTALSAVDRLQAAVATGDLEWGGGSFRPDPPSVVLPDGESLAEFLTEARHR